jgi:hypothetical protein
MPGALKREMPMRDKPGDFDSESGDWPGGLVEDLFALYQADVGVPSAVEAGVLNSARRELQRRRRRRALLRSLQVTAAAAVVAMAVWVGAPREPGPAEPRLRRPEPIAASGRPEDIDGNGRVDILDAFVLSMRVESAAEPNPRWDFNRDGRVDPRDVDAVAFSAVSLTGGHVQ